MQFDATVQQKRAQAHFDEQHSAWRAADATRLDDASAAALTVLSAAG